MRSPSPAAGICDERMAARMHAEPRDATSAYYGCLEHGKIFSKVLLLESFLHERIHV